MKREVTYDAQIRGVDGSDPPDGVLCCRLIYPLDIFMDIKLNSGKLYNHSERGGTNYNVLVKGANDSTFCRRVW